MSSAEGVDSVELLARAIDQLERLLAEMSPGQATRPTPCSDWTLADLVDHIVAAPDRFLRLARGEDIDWSALTPSAGPDPAGAFRASAEELLASMGSSQAAVPVDWQIAELAVHTYDLARALDRSTRNLDAEVAERGFAFMRKNLTPENREPAFGPQQPTPEGADSYERIAAFAGRRS